MNKRVDIEMVQAGQPRRYADSIYEANLRFNFTDNDKLQYDPPRPVVEQVARLFVRNWVDEPDAFSARLEELTKIAKGQWHVTIREPYCD